MQGAPIQAATSIAAADGRDIPEAVPTEQVYELIKGYGDAAVRAMKGGADAVEIHMAHGYLVNSFYVTKNEQTCRRIWWKFRKQNEIFPSDR